MMYPIVAVCCFYLVIFFIGLQGGKQNKDAESVSEVLVAGRRIPLWIGVVTMTATWVDGGYLNGTAEAVYDKGIAWCQAPIGFAISLVLGGVFFAKVMHEHGFNTMLDPFQQRYGVKLGALMYGPALMGELLWTSGILTALGTTFGVLLGLDFRIAIVISAAMTITYTVQGGLWSIAYTDVAQLAMALCGMAICVPFVFSHFNSVGEVWTLYKQKFPETSSFVPPGGLAGWGWMDSMAMLIFGGIPWHCYFQRVLSSPTAQVAKRLSIIAGGLCLLMAIPPAMLGMAGAVFDWEGHGLKAPEGAFLVLPQVLRDMAPRWVGVLGLCAVAGAIMSSVDASIYSAASMFSWNIMHRILRPSEDPKLLARTNRISIVVLGIVATCIALTVKSIYLLWYLSADLVYVLLFPQLLVVLYYRKATRWGVLAGLAVALILRLGGGEPALGIPSFLPYPSTAELGIWFPFKTLAMFAGLVTTLLVSVLPIPDGECNPVPWIQQ